MIDTVTWMPALLQKLQSRFGDRLQFLGLQGSYRRGEATENSDIDVVLVLDALEPADLHAYRAILQTQPEHEKCCGFVSSTETLRHWPRHELFGFVQDTDAYWKTLDTLLPAISEEDIRTGIRVNASALYHAACHACLFEPSVTHADTLAALFKSAFFVLQPLAYLRQGLYPRTKRALASLLSGMEQDILSLGMDAPLLRDKANRDADALFALLMQWCEGILAALPRT